MNCLTASEQTLGAMTAHGREKGMEPPRILPG
jgi:hypothetical protein